MNHVKKKQAFDTIKMLLNFVISSFVGKQHLRKPSVQFSRESDTWLAKEGLQTKAYVQTQKLMQKRCSNIAIMKKKADDNTCVFCNEKLKLHFNN